MGRSAVLDWTMQRAAAQPGADGMPWVKEAAMALHAYDHGLEIEAERKSLTKAEKRAEKNAIDHMSRGEARSAMSI